MATISVSLPSDGSTADVADFGTPVTTIVNAINGNLDSTNISSLSGTKITAGSIPGSALDSTAIGGYITGLTAPNTVTALGNRSYSLLFNSVNYSTSLSAGMRLRTTRTVAAPTQCTSLNGTTQYYSKTSPAGMTFTDDFAASAWIKLTSYPVAAATIASRYNGTSGWSFQIGPTGQLYLYGFNASSANHSEVVSYQSVPLNKWIHVAAQLDMSAFTASTTTSYVMFDGLDVPATVTRTGTNPTALINNVGNLEIGSSNSGTGFFSGKIAQVAIYSAKVTQATILASMNQGLAGTETSLISAYSFNNTINDLNTTNANNLTANGSAVATNADSPFGGQADGTISSILDYAIVQKVAFSTNTTVTVQVPEGCTIPTSGGVSSVVYSSNKAPYGCPVQKVKWQVSMNVLASVNTSGTVAGTIYNPGGLNLNVPLGEWLLSYDAEWIQTQSASTTDVSTSLSTSSSAITSPLLKFAVRTFIQQAATSNPAIGSHSRSDSFSAITATPVYVLITIGATFSGGGLRGNATGNLGEQTNITAENSYL